MNERRGPSELGEFVGELKRRKVLRVAVVYIVLAVGVVVGAGRLFPDLGFPEWTNRLVVLAAVLGLPVALLLAWALETTPEGIRRQRPPPPRPEHRRPEPPRGRPAATNRWERFWQAYERASMARERPGEEPPEKGRGPWARAALVLLLIVGAVGVYAVVAAQRGSETGSGLPGRSAVAVLPFAETGRGGGNRHFAEGFAEEILDALAAIDALEVVDRSSSFRFEGRTSDVRSVGDSLGARYVLEGSVGREGGRLRVTAQLVSTDDGSLVWSESFDRAFAARELFAIQEEIARSAAMALGVELGPGEEPRLVAASTGNAEAYELFLRARRLWRQGTSGSLRRAADLLRAAVDRDSTFARAHAALAAVYGAYPVHDLLATPGEAAPRARAAAERALALDPELAEGHAALARALAWEREWEDAERHYRRAVDLDPRNATTRSRFAWLLAARGRMDEALAEAHAGARIGPYVPAARGAYAAMLLFAGRPGAAVAEYRRLEDLLPGRAEGPIGAALSLSEAGRASEALEAARRALRAEPASPRARTAMAVVALGGGDEETARRILDEMVTEAGAFPGTPPDTAASPSRGVAERAFWIAGIHSALSEPDSAFAWLLRVEDLDGGARPARGWDDVTIARLRGLGRFDVLRPDPRYGVLLSRLGVEAEE